MRFFHLWLGAVALAFIATSASARTPLRDLSARLHTPEAQRELLREVTRSPLDGTPVPAESANLFAFPFGSRWVALGSNDPVYDEQSGTLLFTCVVRRSPKEAPVSAASYLLRDREERPIASGDVEIESAFEAAGARRTPRDRSRR